MSDSPEHLPPDLRDLEHRLQRRLAPPAGTLLRDRVLAAMRAEQAPSALSRAAARWNLVAAAAAVLLWMNLSLIGSAATTLRGNAGATARESREAVAELRRLLPELSEVEARRQFLLLQARSQTVMAPRPQARLNGIDFLDKGMDTWDTH